MDYQPKLLALLQSKDEKNIKLGLTLLQQKIEEGDPDVYKFLTHITFLDHFYLERTSNNRELKSFCNDILEELGGVEEPNEGPLMGYLGVLFCYGGSDFSMEESCYEYYMGDLARVNADNPHLDMQYLADQLYRSSLDFELITGKALGQTYLLNHGSRLKVREVMRDSFGAKRDEILIERDYLLKLRSAFKAERPIKRLTLNSVTVDRIPNNFDIYPNLKYLRLYCLRTRETYRTGQGVDDDDAFVTFYELPDSIAQLKKLKTLDLSRNRFGTIDEPVKIPDWLSELKELSELYLPFCYIYTVPKILAQLPNLKELILPQIHFDDEESDEMDIYCGVIQCTDGATPKVLDIDYFRELLPHVDVRYQEYVVRDYDFERK